MKLSMSKRGLSLVELVVSITIVSIVLLGIVSVNFMISGSHQDYAQQYLGKSTTQITINHMLNNVFQAVGSANCNDEAILGNGVALNACPMGGGGVNVADANTFCVHQPAGNGNNVINSAQDIWVCYSFTPCTSSPCPANAYQINWCAETYNGGVPNPRGASSCSTSGSIVSGPTFLGTARANPTVSFTNSGGRSLFSITVENCLNNNSFVAPSCVAGGISTDPARNPEVSLSGNIIPPQASAQ